MGTDHVGGVDPRVRAEIEARLEAIATERRVRILLAVESGSRAWGFPSPDSDYDVRFVYAHERDWYLSIDSRRDVIEVPIDGALDISGWDIRKALALLLKANPVLQEWLVSPVRYRADEAVVAKLRELVERTNFRRPATHHYLHLGESSYAKAIEHRDEVVLKKYFYALRPALMLMWLRTRPDAPPPMTLAELHAGLDLPAAVSVYVDELIARKRETKELGTGPRNAALDALIESEFACARDSLLPSPAPTPGLVDAANALFREIVSQRRRDSFGNSRLGL